MTELLARWFSVAGQGLEIQGKLWASDLLWSQVIPSAVAGVACYAITAALLVLLRKRRIVRINRMFALFALFFFIGGTGYFIDIWMLVHPGHWLGDAWRMTNVIVSLTAAVMLWRLVPASLQQPSTSKLHAVIDQLEHQIEERKKAEEALRQSQAILRELAAYQERIREDERKRIAREIHDELGQNLLALRLDISALHARTGDRHPHLRERATAALDYIDTTLKSIRAIMNNLRPSVLDLGLQAAIEWQVDQFERRNAVVCEVLMNDDGHTVPEAQATAVFRILQESLNNIGRHASATIVHIEVRIDDQRLTMEIRDNGVGMHPDDRRKAHRFGLIGIEERVTMLGGEVWIDGAPGQGTTVRLTIPLREDASKPATAEA